MSQRRRQRSSSSLGVPDIVDSLVSSLLHPGLTTRSISDLFHDQTRLHFASSLDVLFDAPALVRTCTASTAFAHSPPSAIAVRVLRHAPIDRLGHHTHTFPYPSNSPTSASSGTPHHPRSLVHSNPHQCHHALSSGRPRHTSHTLSCRFACGKTCPHPAVRVPCTSLITDGS